MSLTKRVRSAFSRRSTFQQDPPSGSCSASDRDVLMALWPDGTFKLPWGSSGIEMDRVTRWILFLVWQTQDRKETQFGLLKGMKLNPGMFSANEIPADWKVSIKVLNKHGVKEHRDPRYTAYVGAMLEHMGRAQ